MNERDAALLDEFCDQLWLEDGLAKNTLASYRRDLRLFGDWLAGRGGSIGAAAEADVLGYFAFRHRGADRPGGQRPRATTQARIASSLKRFYRFLIRSRTGSRPIPRSSSTRRSVAPRFPKTLSEADVEALLAAPDVATPLGLARPRHARDRSTRRVCACRSWSG